MVSWNLTGLTIFFIPLRVQYWGGQTRKTYRRYSKQNRIKKVNSILNGRIPKFTILNFQSASILLSNLNYTDGALYIGIQHDMGLFRNILQTPHGPWWCPQYEENYRTDQNILHYYCSLQRQRLWVRTAATRSCLTWPSPYTGSWTWTTEARRSAKWTLATRVTRRTWAGPRPSTTSTASASRRGSSERWAVDKAEWNCCNIGASRCSRHRGSRKFYWIVCRLNFYWVEALSLLTRWNLILFHPYNLSSLLTLDFCTLSWTSPSKWLVLFCY